MKLIVVDTATPEFIEALAKDATAGEGSSGGFISETDDTVW